MTPETVADSEFSTEEQMPHLCEANEPTQTIDLQGLLLSEFSTSGAFDLRSIGATALGKLLEALPVPILLIDKWFFVSFVNKAFTEISDDYEEIQGARFIDILPSPDDAERARILTEKTMALLERVFAERKPRQAEAILKIGEKKIWARLYLRTIRVNADRHIMAIIEDVTAERSQARISGREERTLRQALQKIKLRVHCLEAELSQARQRLDVEIREHAKTKEALRECLNRDDLDGTEAR